MTIYRLLRILLGIFLFLLLIFGLIAVQIKWPGSLAKIVDLVIETVVQLHRLIVSLAVGVFFVMEGVIIGIIIWKILWKRLIEELIQWKRLIEELTQLKRKLISFLLWSAIFIVLGAANLYVFDVIVRHKLVATIEILSPKEMSNIPEEVTPVSISTRNLDISVYIIVETPQGTLWIQDKLFPKRFKDNLRGKARLGEGEAGIGEFFRIFAIAPKEDLPIGILNKIPPDAIYSNTVTVRRVQ